ncbi:MAG: glycosyltransferase [Candidatus Velthaea sp.]
MDYSIVIPVFNREDLTRQCLRTLRSTLTGAGNGEVIVVDNGSDARTAAVLADFPWVSVLRNERNLGFAAACNQGARAARGRYVVHLNNDTEPLAGWLASMLARFADPGVGVVGARLLFPNDTLQHAGVVLAPVRFGPEGFGPYHLLWQAPREAPGALAAADFEVVTGACLAAPRDLFLELGGFDERYWNGYEDVDFCLNVRSRGLRVVYEPAAVLYHYESQSGIQRKRRLMHNVRLLGERWALRVAPDHNRFCDARGFIRREMFANGVRTFRALATPPATAFVHGPAPADADAFLADLLRTRPAPQRVVWAAAGPAPHGAEAAGRDVLNALCAETEHRGDRYIVFVATATQLEPNWLPELIDAAEFASDVAAATVVAPDDESEFAPMAADARCTLVALRTIPQHLRIDASLESVDGAVTDWVARAVEAGRAVRRTYRPTARLGPAAPDAAFERRHGASPAAFARADAQRLEDVSRPREQRPPFASIVMLSWNAPEYTEIAVQSIREHTRTPHEIIIIDNGSGPETIARLRALQGVRVIYNAKNEGFAYGCNQGIAAAAGTHVVLLNNDVVVTDGWLEALLEAQRRDPTIGISAPRSNFVAGHQQVHDAAYGDPAGIHTYARERRRRFGGRLYHTDRVIGFCMCIPRAVIDEVGGIDTRYPVGNFEDDDFCIRVRAAGYGIAVCEDAFIHHFGNVSFKANKVDYGSQLARNWTIFAERWGFGRTYPTTGYDPLPAIARGFVRSRDYVELPRVQAQREQLEAPAARDVNALTLLAVVENEADWSRLAPMIGNYARAFAPRDGVLLALATLGGLDANALARRVERAVRQAGVDPDASPDIEIAEVADFETWRSRFAGDTTLALVASPHLASVAAVRDRSRSGLTRLVRTAAAS